MFPSPQSALPLPLRPNIERYRKIAKELVKACRSSSDPAGLDGDWADQWSEAWIGDLVRLSGIALLPHLPVRIEDWIGQVAAFARRHMQSDSGRRCTLADAQFVLARSHGFQSWPRFAEHVEALHQAGTASAHFEAAADAIVTGNAPALQRLLSEDPQLARARSGREHGAALLHYAAANGVEGYRQRTPANAVEIAALLLAAGADVDATAHVYGADCTTLSLAATSGHPERAGVQEPLLALLLDHGARVEPSLIKSCLANGRIKSAEFLASYLDARGVRIGFAEAAGLGRLDWIAPYLAADGTLPSGAELRDGFLFACQFGRDAMIAFLLDRGASIEAADASGQTGLHHAAIGGHASTVALLLGHNPPLEAVNSYGGTPLGQALWSAAHSGDVEAYLAILEALTAAGAKLPERHVPVNPQIDAWLEQRGSLAEPSWNWYGEERKLRLTGDEEL
jgi:hypothetical protein